MNKNFSFFIVQILLGFISIVNYELSMLENQFIYPSPKGSKLIFFAPHGVGVDQENQWAFIIAA